MWGRFKSHPYKQTRRLGSAYVSAQSDLIGRYTKEKILFTAAKTGVAHNVNGHVH